MNEMLQLLKTRRSIRTYKKEQITDEELLEILEAGKYAPSCMGQQPVLFIVIQNPVIRENIARLNAEHMGPDADPFFGAPTVIMVMTDKNKEAPIEDGSLAIGNMLHAAHALNLGSCWVQIHHSLFELEEGKAILKEWGYEGDYVCVGACVVGYPEGVHPQAAPRRAKNVRLIK